MNFLFEDKSQADHLSSNNQKKGRTFHKNRKKSSPSNTNRPKIKIPKKISEKYLYNSGLAYLQRFTSSSANFRSVMMRKIDKSCHHHTDQSKEDCIAILDTTVERFEKEGHLNDKEYLRGMITSLRRRGQSTRQIEMKLRQKGLPHEDILRALRKHDSDAYENDNAGDFYAALTFARKKKLGPYDKTDKYEFQKALAVMVRAGFYFETAKKIIEMNDEDLEEYTNYLR